MRLLERDVWRGAVSRQLLTLIHLIGYTLQRRAIVQGQCTLKSFRRKRFCLIQRIREIRLSTQVCNLLLECLNFVVSTLHLDAFRNQRVRLLRYQIFERRHMYFRVIQSLNSPFDRTHQPLNDALAVIKLINIVFRTVPLSCSAFSDSSHSDLSGYCSFFRFANDASSLSV